ncbi:cytochrome P450 [Streptomyces sp. RKAG293]|uniref:cytochrome P450 n=1 Tax=Streptomyces sp. RKAG293 TaxID=2893403 RepID=UPI002034556B|nr:cytochrome P450 [Streptomyces sp. RKAG293]MCM2422872.1 cytochrome P450 [Streptomyces sp. RKAG293]
MTTDAPAYLPPRTVATVPGCLPLVGHSLALLRDPIGVLQSIRPLGDLVEIRLGTLSVYAVNSPALLREMLVTDAVSYEKGRYFQKSRPFLGNGLPNSEGDFHRRQRRLMIPAFHREKLNAYTGVMRLSATTYSEAWTPHSTIDVASEMYAIGSEAVAKALFGSALGNEEVRLIRRWLPTYVHELMRRVVSPVDWLDRLPTPGNRRFRESGTQLRKVVDRLIRERLDDDRPRTDLLGMLMAARDADTGEPMSPDQLHDEVMTVMAAGIETASTSLTWLFHEVGARPEIERRLHAELDDVLGSRPVTFEDLPKLVFTQNLVRETLRLRSPAWILMRRPARPGVVLGGVEIPEGTELLFSPLTLHRDPGLYPNPMEFDPDRWLTADPRGWAFLPFGAGPRKCIGDHFALTEMATVVATVAARWRLVPLSERPPREVPGAVLVPSLLLMSPRPRATQTRGAGPRGDAGLRFPFPARISPDAARAAAEHLQWPRSFGLLLTDRAAERHARGHYAELAARFHPAATGPDLALGVDQMSWFFCFDDAFDGPSGDGPGQARTLVDAVADTLDAPPAPDAPPLVRAFRDLWLRSCEGMSPSWRERAAAHWRAYLYGHVEEAANRHSGNPLTVDEYLRLRRDTIGVQPTLDLAERIGHYELPADLFASDIVAALRTLAAEIDSLHNDLYSLAKEDAGSDPHNLLLILRRADGADHDDACASVLGMLHTRIARFRDLEGELRTLDGTARLGAQDRTALDRYLRDALHTVMRGPYDWALRSGRYSTGPQ